MGEDVLRQTGIEAIGEVPWGTHFCQFYKTKQDLIELLVPYFKEGLAQNEFCMWVTSEPLTEAEATSALRKAVPDVDRCLARGQLEILPYTDWYHRGGIFEADRVLKGWADKLDRARAKGFEGLRLSGNTFWLESKEWRAFTDYEQKVNSVIGQFRMLALCTYSLDKCGASEVIDVVSNHQFALIKRQHRWTRIESAEQRRTEEALRESTSRYQTLVESLPHLVWTCLPDGRCDYLSRQWVEYTGISEADQLGYGWVEQLHPEDRQRVRDAWGAAVRAGVGFDVEFRIRRADGQYRWFKTRAVPLRDLSGHIVKWFGSNTDSDEQRRAEEGLRKLAEELDRKVKDRTAALSATNAALREEIAGRKRLEAKQAQLVSILEATTDFVAMADADGRVLYMNRAGRKLIGFGEEEDLTGLRIADKDQPQWPADFLQKGLSTAEREGRWSGETELPARDGRKIPVSQVVLAHKNAAGAVAFFSTIARDITERKQAEETLRQAEQKLREILEHSTNVFYSHTPDHVLTYLSTQASALLACAPATAQTKWTEFLTDHPVNQQGFELTRRAIDTGQAQPAYELELKAMDGRVIWVEVHEAPVVRDGKTTAIVGSLTDITDRKRAEQEVRLAKERFQSLVETIGDWIWEIDRNGRYTYVSPRIQDLLGYEPADVIGKTPFELMPPEEAERVAATFETFLSVRAPFTGLENTNLHKDGRRIVLETSGRPVFDGNGEFLGYRGTDRDITERKQSEEEQRRLRHFLDSIIENLPDMVFVKDAGDLRFVLFNKAGEALIGRSHEELIGKCDHDFFPKEQADFFAAKDRDVLAGRRLLDIPEELIQTRDKGQRILHTKKIPILDEQGVPRYLLGLSRDITDRKQMEAQAARLERLAAIGQLLGGLAHELRNPLFILTGHLQLFREKLLQQEYATLPADLEKIESAAGRMSRITERFLALARPSQPRLEPCAVPTVLTQMLEFLGNELMKSQIRVDTAIAPDLPLVLADPRQLQEVFLNLMMNAMQAMAKAHGRGTLTVSAALAASADTGHGEGVTRGQGEGERWIEVRIQDDGPGIPPEHRAKLFEPFFSTKTSGEGTGLGLWAVRTTVMALGGTVTCESDVGQGATFIVRLPVSEELPIQRH